MLHLNLSPLFWSPLTFGPTVVPSARELLKNVTQLWKINKNDKIPLPESPLDLDTVHFFFCLNLIAYPPSFLLE